MLKNTIFLIFTSVTNIEQYLSCRSSVLVLHSEMWGFVRNANGLTLDYDVTVELHTVVKKLLTTEFIHMVYKGKYWQM